MPVAERIAETYSACTGKTRRRESARVAHGSRAESAKGAQQVLSRNRRRNGGTVGEPVKDWIDHALLAFLKAAREGRQDESEYVKRLFYEGYERDRRAV